MKKTCLFFVLLVLSNLMLAQKNVPAIVVVDGTLPESIGFTCVTRPGDTLSFPYFRSHFKIDDLIYEELQTLPDTATLYITMAYTEWYEGPPKKKTYEFKSIMWKEVLMSGNVLINITTFNNEKTVYYVDYSGGLWVKVYEYDKRFGNRKKAFQRIHAIYPKLYTNKKNKITYGR